MDAKFIDDNNALSYHLRFFKDARTKELEEKRVSRGKVKLPDNFNKKSMEDYFKEWLLIVCFVVVRIVWMTRKFGDDDAPGIICTTLSTPFMV